MAITRAMELHDNGPQSVTLPRARQAPGSWRHYRITFDADPNREQSLFIPVLSQRAVISLNGIQLDDTGNRTSMVGLASGIPALISLPPSLLRAGQNTVEIRLQSVGLIPAYLSRIYIGSRDQLGSHYRVRVFVLEYLKLMVPASQLLIALVILVVWLYRPRDPLFGWLTLLMMLSMVTYLGMVLDLIPHLVRLMPYFSMIGSAAALIMIIVVLLIAGRPPPLWLRWMPFALPGTGVLLALSGTVPATTLVLLLSSPINISGLLISLAVLIRAALHDRPEEAAMLLLPMLMAVVAGIHDFLLVLSLLDGPLFLSVYYRPLLLLGFAMILMRRLGLSLTRLDNVNVYLTRTLNEQEQELARLHEDERSKATQQVRGEERQRLTRDLHDGLSGHLVSIIALAEQEQTGTIENSAREALDDLRLVIHSLDIRDDELPLALSGLRERLERQLKRMGIELNWSIVRLPDIANASPTQVLNILRILQEAITNAIKHANPSRVLVQGTKGEANNQALILVENDGLPFHRTANYGDNGLNNMRRRIHQLGGEVQIEPLPSGTRVWISFPRYLPDANS